MKIFEINLIYYYLKLLLNKQILYLSWIFLFKQIIVFYIEFNTNKIDLRITFYGFFSIWWKIENLSNNLILLINIKVKNGY